MTAFKQAHARGSDWAGVAKSCADQLSELPAKSNLGLLYVTDPLAGDLGSILTFLRQTTGVQDWVGTVGIGVCAGGVEYFDEPAASVLVASLPDESFRTFQANSSEGAALSPGTQDWVAQHAAPFAVVHGDPANGAVIEVLEQISLDAESFLVGGLTASRSVSPQIAGDMASGGVSGVLFGPSVQVATGLSQGCTPLSEPRLITEGEQNVIMGIDGQPALDVLKEDMGELLSRDLARAAGYIHAGFPVRGSDTRDYVVRNLMGVDPERGWVAIGGDVSTGDQIVFVRRDPTTARDDLKSMAEGIKKRLDGPPKAGLYFSCVARGAHMFGDAGVEVSIIREVLGDFPMTGFFGNGEISNARLYGYTGVLTIFT